MTRPNALMDLKKSPKRITKRLWIRQLSSLTLSDPKFIQQLGISQSLCFLHKGQPYTMIFCAFHRNMGLMQHSGKHNAFQFNRNEL